MDDLVLRARQAHADAWELEGRLRAGLGGGAHEVPGARLMASGLPHPQWNNGDVHDVSSLDLAQVRAWYGALGVPWGLRVPSETPLGAGTRLFTKRLMVVVPEALVAAQPVEGVVIRRAGQSDLDVVTRIDAESFGEEIESTRRWIGPRLTSASHVVAVAELDGEPVGVATVGVADGRAGPTAYVSGVGVVQRARRRGIGRALSAWVAARGIDQGASLVHLHPNDDGSARLYRGLGYVDAGTLDVYVDV